MHRVPPVHVCIECAEAELAVTEVPLLSDFYVQSVTM